MSPKNPPVEFSIKETMNSESIREGVVSEDLSLRKEKQKPTSILRRHSDPAPAVKPEKAPPLESKRRSLPSSDRSIKWQEESEFQVLEYEKSDPPIYSILIKELEKWPEEVRSKLTESSYRHRPVQAFLKTEDPDTGESDFEELEIIQGLRERISVELPYHCYPKKPLSIPLNEIEGVYLFDQKRKCLAHYEPLISDMDLQEITKIIEKHLEAEINLPKYSLLIKEPQEWPRDIKTKLESSSSYGLPQVFLKIDQKGKDPVLRELRVNVDKLHGISVQLPTCCFNAFMNIEGLTQGDYRFIPGESVIYDEDRASISPADENMMKDQLRERLREESEAIRQRQSGKQKTLKTEESKKIEQFHKPRLPCLCGGCGL